MRPPHENAIQWYVSPSAQSKENRLVSPTRDIFQARLGTLFREMIVGFPENETALFTAVVGEIGNNCYDHNLGQWKDISGCWFDWEFAAKEKKISAVIADRGQGILNSLKRVQPGLETEAEALKIAFERKISGRSPEHRGNGLKFVRSIVNHHPQRGLLFYSGSEGIQLGGIPGLEKTPGIDKIKNKSGTGTFAWIIWGLP